MNVSRRWFIGGASSIGALAGCRCLRICGEADDAAPNLAFGVVSDVHVRLASDGKGLATSHDCTTLIHTFEWFRDQGVDAVMIVGDIADKGMVAELEAVADAWQKVFPGSKAPDGRKVERVFVYGNHDWEGFKYGKFGEKLYPDKDERARRILRTDMKANWERIFDEPYAPIYRKDVKGYSFIGAHWQTDQCRGRDELAFEHVGDWFAAHGKALDPSRPFFYCQHPHPQNTVYGPWAWGHDRGVTTKALSAFPNAVAFSGHSHYSLTDERSIWQGAFTSLGTSSLRYTGLTYNQYPDTGYENSGGGAHDPMKTMRRCETFDGRQGLLVRVFGDHITFRRREFVKDRLLGDDWVMPLPSVEPKPFTFAARAAVEKAPEFGADAKLSISKTHAKTRGGVPKRDKKAQKKRSEMTDALELAFPQATALRTTRPIEYELTFTPDTGEALVRHVLASGFNQSADDPRAVERQTCTLALSQLPAAPFKIEVRAVSSLGRKSAPIVGVFKG